MRFFLSGTQKPRKFICYTGTLPRGCTEKKKRAQKVSSAHEWFFNRMIIAYCCKCRSRYCGQTPRYIRCPPAEATASHGRLPVRRLLGVCQDHPLSFLPTVPRIYTFHADTCLIRIGTLPDAKSNVSLQSLCQLYYKILLYFCQ